MTDPLLQAGGRQRRKLYFKMNGLGESVAKALDRLARNARKKGAAKAPEPPSTPPAVEGISAPDRVVQTTIADDEAGQRLDNYLFRRVKGVPKSHLYRIIRGGELRVNGKRVEADYRIRTGDVLRMPPMRTALRDDPGARAPKHERTIDPVIVHEDDDLLVVDKPAGVAVHGGSGISFGIIEQLRNARPTARFLELAHRLDRETSGLLMVAKSRRALVALHDDLREGRVKKRYRAASFGPFPEARRTVKAPLAKFVQADGERRVRTVDASDPDAMAAHTVFHRLEAFRFDDVDVALLDVELHTGRTHQIRVHLAHLGRPVVGDDKYGDFTLNKRVARGSPDTPTLERMFLHAARLSLDHPVSREPMQLEASLPDDCARFLDQLRTASHP